METIVVDVIELERNLDHYIEIGKETIIVVTKCGRKIFTVVPERIRLLKELESLFDTLPEEAYDAFVNKEISRE